MSQKDKFTNNTYSIEGTGGSIVSGNLTVNGSLIYTNTNRYETIWIPAGNMYIGDSSPPALVTFDNGTFTNYGLAFDSSSFEIAKYMMWLPPAWYASTLKFRFLWYHGSTVTNFGVAWNVQGVLYRNGDVFSTVTITSSGGANTTVVDTGGTTNALYISDVSANVTIGSAAGVSNPSLIGLDFWRNPTHGSDTLAVDAVLLGVQMYYPISYLTDGS